MPLCNNNKFLGNCYKKIAELHENSLLRFLFVGALGTIVNIIIFFIFADYLNFNASISSIIAFSIAVTQNYLLNHFWSFKKFVNFQVNRKSYIKYVCVNIFGLIANLIVLNLILIEFNPTIKVTAQFSGVLAGTVFNFILSRFYVFNKNP
jgi:dolichol-phosphate mannosyltransferase